MAIVFGTSTTRFTDFTDPNGGLGQFLDRTRGALTGALNAMGERHFENSFVDDGTQNVPGSSFVGSNISDLKKPLKRSFITQHVQATVLVKKRMFSTLRENFDLRFMDDKERTQIRAIKNLFKRKCETIAFYEGLVVLEKVVEDPSFLTLDNLMGSITDSFFNVLGLGFGIGKGGLDFVDIGSFLTDTLNLPGFAGTAANYMGKILRDLVVIKQINERAKQNSFTTWISDSKTLDLAGTGPGVGVIEFTLLKSISTTVSLTTGAGNCSLSIEDPLHLTKITESDVELAIEQAIRDDGFFGFGGVFDLATQLRLEGIEELDQELNTSRRARGVSEVNFTIPLKAKDDITGTLINFNAEFTQQTANSPEFFGAYPPGEAFTSSELARVFQIFVHLQEFNASRNRFKSSIHRTNKLFNPIRTKMRAEFVGQSIIQPMDAIHVFVNSFTRDDSAIQTSRPDLVVDELPGRLHDQRLSSEFLKSERKTLAPDLPQWIYNAVRSPFIWRGTGPQVFSGLVNDISFNYESQNGTYTTRVNAVDNIKYLELSRINTQPGLSQPQGVLEDPLTPYDIDVSESTGLINKVDISDENKRKLSLLRFSDGPFLGEKIDSAKRIIQDTSEGRNARVLSYQHTPGLVYKWKSGIISATQDINLGNPTNPNRSSLANVKDDFGLTILDDPFANLDTANILSILITGQPHSYSSFIKNSMSASTFTQDNSTNSRGYFNYLFDFLERSDKAFGNFIPAKSSLINPSDVAQRLRMRLNIKSNIASLNSRKAKLEDKIQALSATNSADTTRIDIQKSLDKALAELAEAESNATGEADIRTYGDDTFIHLKQEDTEEISKQLKSTVQKRPEDVRFNQDKNYFIVSERYDSDSDVQAFILNLKGSGPDLFQSTDAYKTPLDKCKTAATQINFEFFADSQGNLRFRPPEYNKVPLSLMKKVVELSRNDGLELAPKFVINLLAQRAQLVQDELLMIDLELYEKSSLLGALSIVDANFALFPNSFGLALKEEQGKFILDLSELERSANANASVIFNEQEQNELAFNISSKEVDADSVSRVIRLRNRLFELRGGTTLPLNESNAKDRETVTEEFKQYITKKNATSNRLRITNKIAILVSRRQSLVTLAAKLSENQQEIINPDGSFARKGFGTSLRSLASSLTAGLIDAPQMPKFMRDLMEDDITNQTGAGDSNRFIINDDVIMSMNFTIQPPTFNRVDVFGDENLVGRDITGSSNGLPLVFWAGATDFDSWRQYGARAAQSVNRPAFNNAETQCAPYAVFLLLQQRKSINKGKAVIVGNEHYQAGDVVYINERQMLYYVDSVMHEINLEKGSFITTLSLTYGHCLGEYIPTPWDIMGQVMLSENKKAFGNIKANRWAVPSNHVVELATLSWNPEKMMNFVSANDEASKALTNIGNGTSITKATKGIKNNFVKENISLIINAINRAHSRINSKEMDSATIEVRGYYVGATKSSSKSEIAASLRDKSNVTNFIGLTAKMLSNFATKPKSNFGTKDGSISLDLLTDSTFSNRTEGSKIVEVPAIDITKDFTKEEAEKRYMPSAKAWSNGAEVARSIKGIGLPTNSIDIVLVIDKSKRGDKNNQ